MSKEKEYVLRCTKAQLEALQHATELYARVCMGQWQEAFRLTPLKKDLNHNELYHDLKEASVLLSKPLHNNIDGHASFLGIGNRLIPPKALSCWDTYQVIRHRLAWERAIEKGGVKNFNSPRCVQKMFGVSYNTPMRYDLDPLPRLK